MIQKLNRTEVLSKCWLVVFFYVESLIPFFDLTQYILL